MRAGVALAGLIAVYAALLFADLASQAVHQFERHVEARASDGEAAARKLDGGGGPRRAAADAQDTLRTHVGIGDRP